MLLNELVPGLVCQVLGVEAGALWPLKLHGEGLVVVLPVPGPPHHAEQIQLRPRQLTWVTETIIRRRILSIDIVTNFITFSTFLGFLGHDCTSGTLVC